MNDCNLYNNIKKLKQVTLVNCIKLFRKLSNCNPCEKLNDITLCF